MNDGYLALIKETCLGVLNTLHFINETCLEMPNPLSDFYSTAMINTQVSLILYCPLRKFLQADL